MAWWRGARRSGPGRGTGRICSFVLLILLIPDEAALKQLNNVHHEVNDGYGRIVKNCCDNRCTPLRFYDPIYPHLT